MPPTTFIEFCFPMNFNISTISTLESAGPKPSPIWKFVIPNSREISKAFSKIFLSNFVLFIIIVTGNSESLILSISLAKLFKSFLDNFRKFGVYSIPLAPLSFA